MKSPVYTRPLKVGSTVLGQIICGIEGMRESTGFVLSEVVESGAFNRTVEIVAGMEETSDNDRAAQVTWYEHCYNWQDDCSAYVGIGDKSEVEQREQGLWISGKGKEYVTARVYADSFDTHGDY